MIVQLRKTNDNGIEKVVIKLYSESGIKALSIKLTYEQLGRFLTGLETEVTVN